MSDENSEEDEGEVAYAEDEAVDEDHVVKKSKTKSKLKKPLSSSDTESEDETWGRSKSAYYSSNAAQIDSEDEEANELEEQEARKLQLKARDAIHEDDFGLDEGLEAEHTTEVEYVLSSTCHP
jgi:U3 small nucleolar RNA-associated protein 3